MDDNIKNQLKPTDEFEVYGKTYTYVAEGPSGTHYITEKNSVTLILRDNKWLSRVKILNK